MNEKISRRLRLSLFTVVLTFIVIISIFFSTYNQRINTSHSIEYNNEWMAFINGDYVKDVSLPYKLEADKYDEIKIQNTLNNDFEQSQVIMIRGSLQEVKVLLDDQLIYIKDFEENAFNTYASLYHFVSIPKDSNGKQIEIILISPYKNMSGTLNEIYYGSQSTLRDSLLERHEFKLYISLFTISISIIFILVSHLFFSKQQSYQIYLGVFGLFIGLWLFAESRIVQIYFNNDFLIGSLAYLSLATAPIAATAYIKYYIFNNEKVLFSYLCITYSLNLIMITLLHVFGLFAFFESVMITVSLIAIGFVITFIYLIIEYLKNKELKYRNYILLLSAFSIFILLEVIIFANKDFSETANFASTGIAIVFLILFVVNVINLIKKLRNSLEQQIYEEIANTDQLTKAGSRFAFEKDFDFLFYNTDEDIALIYFDFDDLKYINDHFGHLEGDHVLINGYNIITQIFGKYGQCYRIGGDEFACITHQVDLILFNKLKNKFKSSLKKVQGNNEISMSISIGYTKIDFKNDKKPSDLIARADKEMYSDKFTNKTQA
ncbi:GGDEF domain-containing protein [Mycoplasmatota bacterium]|nr:GGDEF domain-containing protein [Mycoplasmatota bacterium]